MIGSVSLNKRNTNKTKGMANPLILMICVTPFEVLRKTQPHKTNMFKRLNVCMDLM